MKMCTFPSEELFFSLICQMGSEKQQCCCEGRTERDDLPFWEQQLGQFYCLTKLCPMVIFAARLP